MAECKDCGSLFVWATVVNGPLSGKKRPFDTKEKNQDFKKGGYALSGAGTTDRYGKEEMEARYYEDPIAGLEVHDTLRENHFDTCTESSFKKGSRPSGSSGGAKVFVNVQIGNDGYSGYLSKVAPSSSLPFPQPDDAF